LKAIGDFFFGAFCGAGAWFGSALCSFVLYSFFGNHVDYTVVFIITFLMIFILNIIKSVHGPVLSAALSIVPILFGQTDRLVSFIGFVVYLAAYNAVCGIIERKKMKII
jgi:hypothetical protein